MNDELTPSERAALRARIVGGAHDIKPVGAHRSAWIAGSVAAALVVAIAGGVAVTSTLSAPEIATTPSPSPTATATAAPIPTATPTSTPVPSPTASMPVLALGGECAGVLSDDAATAISGVKMTLSPGLPVWDAKVIGGVDCQWRAADTSGWQALSVTVLPWSVVPEEARARAGVVPVCEGGAICDYSQRFGEAWVATSADNAVSAVDAAEAVGVRAASSPGMELALASNAWRLTDCDAQLTGAVKGALGRNDLGPIGTDNVPHGQVWDVLTSRGVAAWCSFTSSSPEEVDPPRLRIGLGAGNHSDSARVVAYGGTPVAVNGAKSAWWIPSASGYGSRVVADAPGGSVEVEVQGVTQERALVITAAIVAALG